MERKIVFRGKRKDTGEWVYGYLADETENFLGEKYTHKVIFEDLKSFQTDNFIHVVKNCEVDPESVGQFTGLLDANGKEIYEGDVLQTNPTPHGRGYVRWHDKEAHFVVQMILSE